ncbi:MAG: beta-ketoacyl-[acyl-carrier-protein] synthase family protein [Paludibacteraceae bacterium]
MDILVSGIGIVSALGVGVRDNYAALRAGQSGLGDITLFKTSLRVPVGEVKYDNGALKRQLGLSQTETVSRTALLGMLAAAEAVDDAHLPANVRVGLVSATSVGGMDLTERFYRDFMYDNSKGRLRMVVHHDSADSTLRIADYCGIRDFSTTISTACSSSANAIMFGARLIRAGLLDAVVAGGTDALCQFTLNGFNSLKILDAQRCRPFNAIRAGLNLGEGAGFVVLQRADLMPPNNYGTLIGFANANDSFHQTASSQSGDGAFLSMSKAMAMAQLSTDAIDYINVHGTGTGNNDAAESAALLRLFGEKIPPFSSTKAFTGHTLAAAGGIEAVFAMLSLRHGAIYPNLGFESPIDTFALIPETVFSDGRPLRVVMSNSFGFGGNCSTLIFRK